MEITLYSKTFRFSFAPSPGMSASFLRDNLLNIGGVLGVSGLPDAFPPDVLIGEIPVYVSVAPDVEDGDNYQSRMRTGIIPPRFSALPRSRLRGRANGLSNAKTRLSPAFPRLYRLPYAVRPGSAGAVYRGRAVPSTP